MAALLREALDAGRARPQLRRVLRTGAAADIEELALLARSRGRSGRRLHDAHPRRVRTGARFARRSVRDRRGAAASRSSISHHKCAGPRNWGRTARDAGRTSTRRTRTQPIGLDAYPYIAGSTVLRKDAGRRRHRHHGHLVDAASGDGGAHAGRHRARMELHAAGGVRAAAAGRRDAISRCARTTCSASCVSGDDDRLRRPAARPASASAAVGDVSARARPLLPRASACSRSRRPCTR